MDEVIAQRDLIVVKPGGEKVQVTLRIGRPYQVDTYEWACPADAEGLFENLAAMRGLDSFGALTLAVSFLRNLLENLVQWGFRLYEFEEDVEVNLDMFFSGGPGFTLPKGIEEL